MNSPDPSDPPRPSAPSDPASPPPRSVPYIIEVKEGESAALCRCGRSQDLPFCDGSHGGTDQRPLVVRFEKTGRVAICGCTRSGQLPYCDGSHKELPKSSS